MTLYLYLTVLAATAAAGAWSFRLLPLALRLLAVYTWITLVIELIGAYEKHVHQQPNQNLYLVYQNAEYVLVAFFYYLILDRKIQRRLILFSIPIIFLLNSLALIGGLLPSHLKHFPFLAESLLLGGWSICYFLQLFRHIGREKLEQNPAFWASVGVVFFYLGSFFVSAYANIINRYDHDLATLLYSVVNHLLNCLYYAMILYAFLCQKKYRKLSSSP